MIIRLLSLHAYVGSPLFQLVRTVHALGAMRIMLMVETDKIVRYRVAVRLLTVVTSKK
jgi:hypothetical protein